MPNKIVNTSNAPAPIGPYSQAVWAGNMLFVSGQIAMNPITNDLEMTNINVETERVMKNIEAILTEAHLSFKHIVKTTIFLSDMNHFAAVNETYGSYFSKNFPARETVAVKTLPKNVNVEISVIAMRTF